MDKIIVNVEVQNIKNPSGRYVVARLVNGQLWFWGSWNDREKAENVADEFENGIVIDMEE